MASGILSLVLAGTSPAAGPTPDDYGLYYLGLYREIAEGDLAAAVETYRRILLGPLAESDPGGLALIRLGICFEKMGKPSEAIDCYDRAIADFSDRVSVLEPASEGLMRLYAGTPDLPREKKELSSLISRGLKRLEEGDTAGAVEILEEAYGLDPDNSYLQYRLASAYRELGRFREAVYYYNLAADAPRYRTDFSIRRELAACYRLSGRPDDALRVWERYLRMAPEEKIDKAELEFELSLVYELIDLPPQAVPPGELIRRLGEGEKSTRDGDYRAAGAAYRFARKDFPKSFLPPARLARLHEHLLADSQTAYWYYKEAISKAPEGAAQRLRARLGYLCSKMGDQDKTEAVLKEYFSRVQRPAEIDSRFQSWLNRWESWLKWRRGRKKSSRVMYPAPPSF